MISLLKTHKHIRLNPSFNKYSPKRLYYIFYDCFNHILTSITLLNIVCVNFNLNVADIVNPSEILTEMSLLRNQNINILWSHVEDAYPNFFTQSDQLNIL